MTSDPFKSTHKASRMTLPMTSYMKLSIMPWIFHMTSLIIFLWRHFRFYNLEISDDITHGSPMTSHMYISWRHIWIILWCHIYIILWRYIWLSPHDVILWNFSCHYTWIYHDFTNGSPMTSNIPKDRTFVTDVTRLFMMSSLDWSRRRRIWDFHDVIHCITYT